MFLYAVKAYNRVTERPTIGVTDIADTTDLNEDQEGCLRFLIRPIYCYYTDKQPINPMRMVGTDYDRPRTRARKACLACNARRVRCNVMETQPCRNCIAWNLSCELGVSRRGK